MEGQERLLTVVEVASLFGVDPRTVRRWTAAGELPSIRLPGGRLVRYRESDVRALLPSDDARPGTTPPPSAGPGPQQEGPG